MGPDRGARGKQRIYDMGALEDQGTSSSRTGADVATVTSTDAPSASGSGRSGRRTPFWYTARTVVVIIRSSGWRR